MAGDWMAIRLDVHDDPAVISISATLGIDADLVVGKLAKLWSWANRQLSDGIAKGVTTEWVDRYVSATGFAAAMIEAGWLQNRSGSIHFPKFDTWNSESAKRRLLDSKRKQAKRHDEPCPQNVRKMSASHADKNRTKGEERKGKERKEVGGNTARPPVSAIGEPDPCREAAVKAVESYQTRRYKTPNPLATYYPAILQEAIEVFSAHDDHEMAFRVFDGECKSSKLPQDATFSALAVACGLKKKKIKPTERPSVLYKDVTAERLASAMGVPE